MLVAQSSAAVTAITSEVSSFGPDLLAIGGVAIGVSAGVLLLRKGWRLVSGMIR